MYASGYGFPNRSGGGGDSPSGEGEGDGKFCWGVNLDGGVNLRRIDFDHSNLFQGQKKLSVNSEHRLKSKLVWTVCTKSIKLKWKWYWCNDCS